MGGRTKKNKSVRWAKKELRNNPNATADEIGVKNFNHNTRKYNRLLNSKAFKQSEANKAGKTLGKYNSDFVEGYNKTQVAANNPTRLKVGVFGKVKKDRKAMRQVRRNK